MNQLAMALAWLLVRLDRRDAALTWRAIGIANGEGFASHFLTHLEAQLERNGIVWDDVQIKCRVCKRHWSPSDYAWEKRSIGWVHRHGSHGRFKGSCGSCIFFL